MIRYGLTQGSTIFFHPGIQDGIKWSKLADLLTTLSIYKYSFKLTISIFAAIYADFIL